MKRTLMLATLVGALCIASTSSAHTARSVLAKLDKVPVADMQPGQCYDLPRITWGGEFATWLANGVADRTQPGSYFHEQGLCYQMVPGDDSVQQVVNYKSGKTPYLRMTYRMLAPYAEHLCKDPRTCPVVITQLTYSVGDHIVATSGITKLTDLRGKRVCLQMPGPHMGLLDDALATANMTWNDIKIIPLDDLTESANAPLAHFKAGKCDAAAVITPDMALLTGGLNTRGDGRGKSVKGAHVLYSSAKGATRSIADVYAVRKDYYDANRDKLERFAAGYLKASEWLKSDSNLRSKQYASLVRHAQKSFGLPTPDDADGLFQDCRLVGYPGNQQFFSATSDLEPGFPRFAKQGAALARATGYATGSATPLKGNLNWGNVQRLGGLTMTTAKSQGRFAETVDAELAALIEGGTLDANTPYSFSIPFGADQADFPAGQYSAQFDKILEMIAIHGNAAIMALGHTDPFVTLMHLVGRCMGTGAITRQGTPGNWSYVFANGQSLNLDNTEEAVRLITSRVCDGQPGNTAHAAIRQKFDPASTFAAARKLSLERGQAFVDAFFAYAQKKGVRIDRSQVRVQGAGMTQPVVPKPRWDRTAGRVDERDASRNRRVEVSIVVIKAESLAPGEGFEL